MSFLDIEAARTFIQQAMEHYHGQPAWFTDWLDDFYIKLGEDWRKITLDELATLRSLQEDGCWLSPSYAMNSTYKMFGRIGRPTTGIIGY